MKKIVGFMLSIILSCGFLGLLAGCSGNTIELKLLSQGEYIDQEELSERFTEWYQKETNSDVKVKVTVKDALHNEEMFKTVSQGTDKYDLICISDYMVERFIDKKLTTPLNKEIIDINDYIMSAYLDHSKLVDPSQSYSVPYMYGTFGLMYNYDITKKHLDSWDVLHNEDYKGQITTKKSVRDLFAESCIYASKDELSAFSNGFDKEITKTVAYKAELQKIFENTSSEMINKAKGVMEYQNEKKLLKFYDDENGKTAMLNKEATAGLYWSCDAGYVMNDAKLDDGTLIKGNKDLWYVIPKEGGSIYLDSFVIGKDSQNVDLANYFLKFICQKDVAILNSEYIGAISPVQSAYDALYEDYNSAKAGEAGTRFEGVSEDWRKMYLDTMFPTEEIRNRCGIMRDYKDAENEIIQMVSKITG